MSQLIAPSRFGGSIATPYSEVVLADAPVGYWRLGEATGTTAADSSGSGYDGTYVACAQGASAIISNAGGDLSVSGNGTSSQITLGVIAALHFNRNFTIEAWIRPNDLSTIYGLWSPGYQGFCMRRNNTSIEFLSDYNLSLGSIECGFVSGNKYHVVCPVDASGNYILYVNDVVKGAGKFTTTFTGDYVRIGADGRDASTVGNFLDGGIDEVAVYNAALSAGRVSAHYAAGSA